MRTMVHLRVQSIIYLELLKKVIAPPKDVTEIAHENVYGSI